MSLTLFNSLTGRKEVFEPINPNAITMYVCGPTVYNYIHLGNARSSIIFDMLYRILEHVYPNVIYARNYTDVDDKINNLAFEQGVSIDQISQKFIKAYDEDMDNIGNRRPTITPKATDHIPDIIDCIQTMINRKHAYVSEGHVLFAVNSINHYASLSNRNLDDMIAGARVEVSHYKKNPMDFVLWKPSTKDQPSWESPWGKGRPGWHIECTAMIHKHLGYDIDIHGGGSDLIFPHHDNEMAQGICCSPPESKYANYWVHNAMLNVDGEKMSKSLGNYIILRDLIKEQPAELVRLTLLSTHYRSVFDWSEQVLKQTHLLLDRLYQIKEQTPLTDEECAPLSSDSSFFSCLLDDINTPKALAELHKLCNQYFKLDSEPLKKNIAIEINGICDFLNIRQLPSQHWFQGTQDQLTIPIETINQLIQERAEAKKSNNFLRADEIRDSLLKQGIQLKDTRQGTLWVKK